MTGVDTAAPARRRGRPPAIRLDDVIDAASAIEPTDITIQAVADRLGVTRAAIYHYVDNVDQLRRLAARSAMVELTYDDSAATSWQEWMVGWAHAMRRWRLANDAGGPGMVLSAEELVSDSVLVAIERGYDILVDAGFPADEAIKAMHFVVGIIWINTQDELLAATSVDGRHPQSAALREADSTVETRDIDPYDDPDGRFEHELQLALDGLSARLARLIAAR